MDPLKAICFGDPVKLAPLITQLTPASNHNVWIISTSAYMDMGSLEQTLAASRAQVLLADAGVAGLEISALMAKRGHLPEPTLFVGLAPSGTAEFDNMSSSGMDRVYPLPVSPATIQQMDTDLPKLYAEISSSWGKGAFGAVVPEGLQASLQASVIAGYKSAVIAIISPKGGAGKTSTSVELSVMLSQVAQLRVVLCDLNMVSGHDRFFLNAPAGSSLANIADDYNDWVKSGGTGTPPPTIFDPYLFSIDPDRKRLFLLPGIISSAQANKEELVKPVAASMIRDLLDHLKHKFDFTILDLGSDINKTVHDAALKAADTVLFIIPPNRAALADAEDHIAALIRRGISKDNILLVLNNVPEKVMENMPTADDAVRTLGIRYLSSIHKETTGEYENTVNVGRSFVARFANKDKNPPTIERVLADLVVLGSNFYPPLGQIWAKTRKTRVKEEKRGLFGKG